jgi:hypothetical protein
MNRKLYVVYKIVRVDGDGYASIAWREGDLPYVRYVPGQWTYTPEVMAGFGFYLCTFESLNAAHYYLGAYEPPHDWELWRCDARGVRVPRVPRLDEERVNEAVATTLDGQPLDPVRLRIPFGTWPPGTLFARAVRLVERIPWDHELLRQEVLP